MSLFFKQDAQTGRYLVTADLQNTNKFRLIIIEDFTQVNSIASGALAAINQAADIALQYYIKSITLPPPVELEYDEAVGLTFPKTFKRGESVEIEFLEDEDGKVWRYLQSWRKQIIHARPDDPLAIMARSVGQGQMRTDYVFRDNQLASKRTGILLLGSGFNNKRQKFPRIMLYGMQFQTNGEIQLSNYDATNLSITATFKVEEIGAPFV